MQDLTTGSLSRHLLTTSSFMLVSMVFQTLYVLVDLYWVSRLGTSAVAAVAVSGNFMFVVLAATQMLGVGTTTLISHAVGARDHARAQTVFNQAQALSAGVGVLFLAAAMATRTLYADGLSADAETAALARDYLLWFIPAMAGQFGLVAMGAALRGTGAFRPGMVVQIATVVLNMALAPLLMFGWGPVPALGVAGTAIATLIAIVVGNAWMAGYFLRAGSYLRFAPREWRPQPPLCKDLLKIGLPAGGEFVLLAIYMAVIYVVSRPFGAAAQAGFGIGGRVMQALFMPAVALGFAVAPVAGQNYGARRADRVRQTFRVAAGMAAGVMLAVTLLVFFGGAQTMRVFSNDPAVIAVGAEYLRIISLTFVLSGVVFVSSSMFQALGNSVPPLLTSLVRNVAVIGPVLLLARASGFALVWVWYIAAGSTVLHITLNLLLLRREFRRRLAFAEPTATPALR
ncbi:MAG: MATE family efflux transporter [Vicinamibacterales bacterium]